MKSIYVAALVAALSGPAYAQDARDCFMGGNCVKSHIIKVEPGGIDGTVLVETRDERYCIPQASATSECEGEGWHYGYVTVRCERPGYITVADQRLQKVAEPNPRPSHATDWADQMWRAVCRKGK